MCEPGMMVHPLAPPLIPLPSPHEGRSVRPAGPSRRPCLRAPCRGEAPPLLGTCSCGVCARGRPSAASALRAGPGGPRAGRHGRVPALPWASVLSVSLGSPCLSRSPAATAIFPRKDDGRGVAARDGQSTARVRAASLPSFLRRQPDGSDVNSMHGLVFLGLEVTSVYANEDTKLASEMHHFPDNKTQLCSTRRAPALC